MLNLKYECLNPFDLWGAKKSFCRFKHHVNSIDTSFTYSDTVHQSIYMRDKIMLTYLLLITSVFSSICILPCLALTPTLNMFTTSKSSFPEKKNLSLNNLLPEKVLVAYTTNHCKDLNEMSKVSRSI